MLKHKLDDLQAFVAVARAGSFTRAAATLGVTQSALSQTIRALEARLQIRLLTRTTRNVAPTEAGERLLHGIGQSLDHVQAALTQLLQTRDKPAGLVRITCSGTPLRTLLMPKLSPLLHAYPDIHIEFDVSHSLRNIVAERFDAGVRLGEAIDQDMIAVPIGPAMHMAAVAAPEYFSCHPKPEHPQDLLQHNCINWRMPTAGGLYTWEFERGDKKLNVRVPGQLVFNDAAAVADAALAGLGLAFLCVDDFAPHIAAGRLIRVLQDWCPPFAGYHLYYPSRRQSSPAFALVLDALRMPVGARPPPEFGLAP